MVVEPSHLSSRFGRDLQFCGPSSVVMTWFEAPAQIECPTRNLIRINLWLCVEIVLY
jgi:hypothetical protein